jgi:hypothetical protein
VQFESMEEPSQPSPHSGACGRWLVVEQVVKEFLRRHRSRSRLRLAAVLLARLPATRDWSPPSRNILDRLWAVRSRLRKCRNNLGDYRRHSYVEVNTGRRMLLTAIEDDLDFATDALADMAEACERFVSKEK